MVTLTAGGRGAPKPEVPAWSDPIPEWMRLVRDMVRIAVEAGEHDRRRVQMRDWLEQNPFHDLVNERWSQYRQEVEAWSEQSITMANLGDRASQLQRSMTPMEQMTLANRLGLDELSPGINQMFAMIAFHTGKADVPTLVQLYRIGPCPF